MTSWMCNRRVCVDRPIGTLNSPHFLVHLLGSRVEKRTGRVDDLQVQVAGEEEEDEYGAGGGHGEQEHAQDSEPHHVRRVRPRVVNVDLPPAKLVQCS